MFSRNRAMRLLIAPLPHCPIASFLIATFFATACTSGPPPPVDSRPYEQRVVSWRADKDVMFRRGTDSPLPDSKRATFHGLAYFPIDRSYDVPSFLTEDRGAPPLLIQLQTSTNERRRMRRIGPLRFTLSGTEYTLTAFADEDERTISRLFVPFADATSGNETYKGGRYLELERTPTGLYDLDFNRAFHPFCVYNPTYDCPVPPKENRLPVAIRAGEKLEMRQ